MRYEWGLGVGHTYSWKNIPPYHQVVNHSSTYSPEEPDEQEPDAGVENEAAFCLDDRENELLGDEESDEGGWTDEEEVSDKEAYLGRIDMYGV